MKSGTIILLAGLLALTLITGCSGEGDGQELSSMVGELTVEGTPLPADGSSMAEVRIRVYELLSDERYPLGGLEVTVISSRNLDTGSVDFIEQPTGPTFADGNTTAYIGSSQPGETVLYADYQGKILCGVWEEGVCIQAADALVTFNP
jgi:hypothetical protein